MARSVSARGGGWKTPFEETQDCRCDRVKQSPVETLGDELELVADEDRVRGVRQVDDLVDPGTSG